jgi:hypothetical protein
MFEKNTTGRGFSRLVFRDDYDLECSLQISSAWKPHVWLGVDRPIVRIMYKDAKEIGLDLQKNYPETNCYGWCDIPIPEQAFIDSRMHLTKKQSFKLAIKLVKFAITGRV